MSDRPSLAALIPRLGDETPRGRPDEAVFGDGAWPRGAPPAAANGNARRSTGAPAGALLARFAEEARPAAAVAEDRIASAVAAARAEALREAEERRARAIDDLESRSRARLESARERWAEEEGGRLADRLRAGLDAVRDQACEATARVLAPLLEAAARERAVAALAEAIRESAARRDPPWIEVTGPPDLIEAVSAALGDPPPPVALVPSAEDVEVRAVADFTVFETALAAWREAVADILAGTPDRLGPARPSVPEAAPGTPEPGGRASSGATEEDRDG